MTRRTNLATLLDTQAPAATADTPAALDESGQQPEPAAPAAAQAGRPRHRQARRLPPGQPADHAEEPEAEAEGGRGPAYLQLERKELRLRADQADQLTNLTRRLNRARGRTGERITDNTLIRVAIDMLLREDDRLRGSTEAELRGSVGL